MPLLLGTIADDFTKATNLTNTLIGRGMRTMQTIGVPEADVDHGDVDTSRSGNFGRKPLFQDALKLLP